MIVELYLKENWVLKIWCFWILVCRRLLRDPWTARRSNQSILKEFSPEYSLKGLMLKLQSFGHLLQRTDSLEKKLQCWEGLKAGGEWDDRRWDGWMASPTWWTRVWASSRSRWWTEKLGVPHSLGSQRVGYDWTTDLTEWELYSIKFFQS